MLPHFERPPLKSGANNVGGKVVRGRKQREEGLFSEPIQLILLQLKDAFPGEQGALFGA